MTTAAADLPFTLTSLRDLALQTLRQLMGEDNHPRDRRLAAAAALRYVQHAEKAAADPPPRPPRRAAPTPSHAIDAPPAALPANADDARALEAIESARQRAFESTQRETRAAQTVASINALLNALSPRASPRQPRAAPLMAAAGAGPAPPAPAPRASSP